MKINSQINSSIRAKKIKDRFRGFLPVVVDLETSGVDSKENAILEMCIVFITMNEEGYFEKSEYFFEHFIPYPNAKLDASSLEFIKIDPYYPLRFAIEEKAALKKLFLIISSKIKEANCQRAILVGHNAWFDLLFLKEAAKRTHLKLPFHAFSSFDTATLGGLVYGQTVLAKAAKCAGISFNPQEAHSAIYDALKTAELFCAIMNLWRDVML